MPKIKTHSGAKKRLRVTGTGKIVRAHAGKRHKLNSALKSAKRKRNLRKNTLADKTNVAQAKRLIPYK